MRYIRLLTCLLLLLAAMTAYAQTPSPGPVGCLRPPEDYTRVLVGEHTLNARTLAMLEQAQTLYGGTIDLAGRAITQGSYIEGNPLSFGTHDGGGAVDISVRNLPIDWSIRYDDIPLVIEALRTAGFAAWYRDEEDGMTPHIHAIALGDQDLSRSAQLQISGRYGYLRGFNGLPQSDGVPKPDQDGEIVLCEWMRELGYADLRGQMPVQSPPYAFRVGMRVYTNTVWGQELNLRREPSLAAQILARLANETPLTLLDGAREADGYRWWLVKTPDAQLGWVVESADGGLTLVP